MIAPELSLDELKVNPEWASLPLFDRSEWKSLPFGAFADSINDRVEPTDAADEVYVGLEHLDSDNLHIRRWGKGSDVIGTKLRFRRGDIIFGRRRAYQRKLAVAEMDGICSAHAMVVRAKPELVLPEFLPFLMISDRFMKRAVEISVGSLSPTINWSTLKQEEFDLPPLEQQKRIADVLWAVDEVAQNILKTLAATELYRAAFLGGRIDSLPEQRIRFRSVQDLIQAGVIDPPQDGNHGELHPKVSDYVDVGVPFIMASDIRDGKLCLDTCKRIPETLARRLRVGFARPGDVLLTHKGTIGLTCIVPPEAGELIMLTPQVTYYRIKDVTRLRSDFLRNCFSSERFQRGLALSAKQSTRDYVGVLAQRRLPLMVPDPLEQDDIVQHLALVDAALASLRSESASTSNIAAALSSRLWV